MWRSVLSVDATVGSPIYVISGYLTEFPLPVDKGVSGGGDVRSAVLSPASSPHPIRRWRNRSLCHLPPSSLYTSTYLYHLDLGSLSSPIPLTLYKQYSFTMRSFATALLLPLALASPLAKRSSNARLAPLREEGESIEDAYIVVLKKDISPHIMALHLGSVEETNGLDVSDCSYREPVTRGAGGQAPGVLQTARCIEESSPVSPSCLTPRLSSS